MKWSTVLLLHPHEPLGDVLSGAIVGAVAVALTFRLLPASWHGRWSPRR